MNDKLRKALDLLEQIDDQINEILVASRGNKPKQNNAVRCSNYCHRAVTAIKELNEELEELKSIQ